MGKITGYIGTYASSESLGIYQFNMDMETGAFSAPALYYEAPNAKYLSLYDGKLAAPVERENQAGVCLLDTNEKKPVAAKEVFCEQKTACYVVQDESFIFTAHYHDGSVTVYRKSEGKPLFVKKIEIGSKAGCHQILLHKHYLLVPCLELDCILIFDRDQDYALSGEIRFSKGTGPRHGVFDRDHTRLFVVSELSNQLFAYRLIGDLNFCLEQVCQILPDGQTYKTAPSSAAIRLSQDERYLYVSTRGADLISVYAVKGCHISPVQQTGCGGEHPRDIVITPDGRYLVVINRTDGGLVSFPLDQESGELGKACGAAVMTEGVSVILE